MKPQSAILRRLRVAVISRECSSNVTDARRFLPLVHRFAESNKRCIFPARRTAMKTRSGNEVCVTVCAALGIIACCISSMVSRQKQRITQTQQLEEAVQNWEGEGGAVVARDTEDEELESQRT